MEYRRFENTCVVRIDKGEEILAVLTEVCRAEQIKLAAVSGIGAVGEATLGVFNREKFAYESQTFTGDMEIASCTGSITEKDGAPYLHLHMVVANVTREFFRAGHLNAAKISLTGEFMLQIIPGTVGRAYDPAVGLNLFQF